MNQRDIAKEGALFLLMAQLELATSSLVKWQSPVTCDQVTLAFRRYKELYDRDNVQHETTTHYVTTTHSTAE